MGEEPEAATRRMTEKGKCLNQGTIREQDYPGRTDNSVWLCKTKGEKVTSE